MGNAVETASEPHISRWWRVVGGLLMNLALGALYAWSVFVAPLEKEFGWKRADTSSVFTWAVVVFALSFIIAGRLQDKLGPFKISLAGCILLTVGFLLCARTSSLTYLIICFGVLVGIGNGFGYATPIPVMAKWFPDKRGLAVGLAVAGYGGGSAIFGPLANLWLIPTYGWRTTFTVLGVVFFVMTLLGALLLKNPPAGYSPAGWTPAPASKVAATTYEFSPGEMWRTAPAWFMWVAYALGTSAGLMVISQLVPFAKSMKISTEALQTITLIVGATGNAAGRILSGWMSDALGRLNVLRLMIGISMVAMPVLYLTGSPDGLHRLLVLRNPAFGERLDDLRLLGHEERWHQLRSAFHRVGCGGYHRTEDRRCAVRQVQGLPGRVLHRRGSVARGARVRVLGEAAGRADRGEGMIRGVQ